MQSNVDWTRWLGGMCCFVLLLEVTTVQGQLMERNKQELLDEHNHIRKMANHGSIPKQPKAKFIPLLKWDDELATMAQKYAGRCKKAHSGVNERQHSQFALTGENIDISFEQKPNPVKFWYDEHQFYDYDTNECRNACNSYKQLVLENTTHVGCGFKKCRSGMKIHICNYGIGLPEVDVLPYKWGGEAKAFADPPPPIVYHRGQSTEPFWIFSVCAFLLQSLLMIAEL